MLAQLSNEVGLTARESSGTAKRSLSLVLLLVLAVLSLVQLRILRDETSF